MMARMNQQHPPIWMDDDWIEIFFFIGFQPQLTTPKGLVWWSLSPLHKAEATKKGKQTNFLRNEE
jgi:hypothetical protein